MNTRSPVSCQICCSTQLFLQAALDSANTREIARKERERLKAQDKYKKDQLEKLRAEQNVDASSGEVRLRLNFQACTSLVGSAQADL